MVAFCATVVCFIPVAFVVLFFAIGGSPRKVFSVLLYFLGLVAVCAIIEIGSQLRRGFRLGDSFSLGWLAVCTSLGQAFGLLRLEPWPQAGALACGFVGGLIATFVWSREPETKEEAGPRSTPLRGTAGRHGLAILLALTLVGVAHAIGTILGWL